MPQIGGYPEVIRGLQAAFARFGKAPRVTVRVGYSADYAGIQHERLDYHHAPPTQAKYLETPMRENGPQYQAMVEQGILNGLTLTQALMVAGIQLQQDSQFLCPVDTGYLRSSAFTEVEEG